MSKAVVKITLSVKRGILMNCHKNQRGKDCQNMLNWIRYSQKAMFNQEVYIKKLKDLISPDPLVDIVYSASKHMLKWVIQTTRDRKSTRLNSSHRT